MAQHLIFAISLKRTTQNPTAARWTRPDLPLVGRSRAALLCEVSHKNHRGRKVCQAGNGQHLHGVAVFIAARKETRSVCDLKSRQQLTNAFWWGLDMPKPPG